MTLPNEPSMPCWPLASVIGVSLTRFAPYFCKSPRVICIVHMDWSVQIETVKL